MTFKESLDRIKKNTIPINWTEADKEHYNNIVTAIEKSIPKKVLDPWGVNIKSGACPICGAKMNYPAKIAKFIRLAKGAEAEVEG